MTAQDYYQVEISLLRSYSRLGGQIEEIIDQLHRPDHEAEHAQALSRLQAVQRLLAEAEELTHAEVFASAMFGEDAADETTTDDLPRVAPRQARATAL